MLPASYAMPFAIVLVLGGAIACFAGYRLFRIVLALYGFILGAMIASSLMAASNAVGMIIAALVGGIVGALILVFAYFIGIALIGAGLGALCANVVWGLFHRGSGGLGGETPWQIAVGAAVVGAITTMVLQRYVIIVSTAFAGAWTLLIGTMTIAGDRATTRAVSIADVWIFYPISPASGKWWVTFVWVALGLVGTGMQLAITSKKK
jgi:Domain of unknown function (DUF4203)